MVVVCRLQDEKKEDKPGGGEVGRIETVGHANQKIKWIEFFGVHGDALLQTDHHWMSWFCVFSPPSFSASRLLISSVLDPFYSAIPYIKNPRLDPLFRVYFSRERYTTEKMTYLNNPVTYQLRPQSVKAGVWCSLRRLCRRSLHQLLYSMEVNENPNSIALLEEKESQLRRSRSIGGNNRELCSTRPETFPKESTVTSNEAHSSSTHLSGRKSLNKYIHLPEAQCASPSKSSYGGYGDEKNGFVGTDELQEEEDFPEVKVDVQVQSYSLLSYILFSTSGENIASASLDGTVRVWTYDSSTSASRNATIYCGAEIMLLEWDCKSDRLVLIGTAGGGIKAWNVDAKRVVCDLNTADAFPSVLDIKCSPVEPLFVFAVSSRRNGIGYIDKLRFASLTVWNMRT
ncbi:hypothetical protein L2E82_48444 [Cichorium intybus]|uniref:Uncharacterized protein n=1 Tax=Cichorium intybus TaxID=13427 RepID=A0ACB8YXC8_CICIN|nr:hypothetical protein L2E82_48444 [Cichorium intybus]